MPRRKSFKYTLKFRRQVYTSTDNGRGRITTEYYTFRPRSTPGATSSGCPEPPPADAATKSSAAASFMPPGPAEAIQVPRRARRSHAENKARNARAWGSIEQELYQARVEQFAPMTSICQQCGEAVPRIIHCADCGPMAYFCEACCVAQHRLTLLHCPQQWTRQLYLPFQLPTPVVTCLQHPQPQQGTGKNVVVIDIKGRQHNVAVEQCGCRSFVCSIVRMGLWPASPTSPTIAFDMALMELLRVLVMECQVSVKGFSQALQSMQHQQPQGSREVNLHRALNSNDAVHRYRNLSYNVRYLRDISHEATDGTQCPVCDSGMQGVTPIYALDGNFRLARKRSAGVSYCPPFHSTRYFLQQNEVDGFVDGYALPTIDTHECSDFKAADKLRSATRSARFDEKGVFGSVCRHELPTSFLNMKYGERLAYPLILLQTLVGQSRTSGTKLGIFYDIACRLHPHLMKNDSSLLDTIKLAVPVFHGYGHKASCQIKYSPRRLAGFGLCDGEGTERLWSYLGRFTTISREMTAGHRHDLLVDALIHWSERVRSKLEDYLIQRLEKAEETLSSTSKELERLIDSIPGLNITMDHVQHWVTEDDELAKEKTKDLDNPAEKYAMLLHKWFQYSPRQVDVPLEDSDVLLAQETDKLEVQLKKLERKLKLDRRWEKTSEEFRSCLDGACKQNELAITNQLHQQAMGRRHLLEVKNRYARGHNLAKKLSEQVKAANKKLHKLLTLLNEVPTSCKRIFDDVKEPTAQMYRSTSTPTREQDLPYHLRRQMVDLFLKKNCSEEEVNILIVDMQALVMWFGQQHASISKSAALHIDCNNTALAARMLRAQLELETRLSQITLALSKKDIPVTLPIPLLEQVQSSGTVRVETASGDHEGTEESSDFDSDVPSSDTADEEH